jgi:hypothetical protein
MQQIYTDLNPIRFVLKYLEYFPKNRIAKTSVIRISMRGNPQNNRKARFEDFPVSNDSTIGGTINL